MEGRELYLYVQEPDADPCRRGVSDYFDWWARGGAPGAVQHFTSPSFKFCLAKDK